MSKYYDCVIIFNNFRYLSYIFELYEISKEKKLRVGYVYLNYNNYRNKTYNRLKELFQKMNFEELSISSDSNIKKLIINWGEYKTEEIKKIRELKFQKSYLFSGLLNDGRVYNQFKNNKFKIDKFIVLNKYLHNFRDKTLKKNIIRKNILAGGIKHKKNIFLGRKKYGDYIIAYPTPFSFNNERGKTIFLKNILRLISSIKKDKKIIIKNHNSDSEKNYLVDKKNFFLMLFFNYRTLINLLLFSKKFINFKIINKYYFKLTSYNLIEKINARSIQLKNISNYEFLSLELFLPYISKGLITGRSNSLWHGLNAKLKTYNCAIDFDENNKFKNFKNKINPYFMKLLDLKNCRGNINFKNKSKFRIKEVLENKNFLKEILLKN